MLLGSYGRIVGWNKVGAGILSKPFILTVVQIIINRNGQGHIFGINCQKLPFLGQ